ncbi:hypothetical protein M885DRAFT_21306 [Pelagophyceae sp. CCMP2097]|nr:hypothetical protein M885DRAFT_21306 [Pelagophyceae sp. CCMP2097]
MTARRGARRRAPAHARGERGVDAARPRREADEVDAARLDVACEIIDEARGGCAVAAGRCVSDSPRRRRRQAFRRYGATRRHGATRDGVGGQRWERGRDGPARATGEVQGRGACCIAARASVPQRAARGVLHARRRVVTVQTPRTFQATFKLFYF